MNEQLAQFTRAVSILLGWTYVFSWSASFYPQPLLNWRRKSTSGITVDYPALNVLGFVSYSISTTSFLYSPTIRAQYAIRYPRAPEPTVRFNDVAFALHAMALVLLTYSQFFHFMWCFDVPKNQNTSRPIRVIVLGSVLAVIIAISRAAMNDRGVTYDAELWSWIDVVSSALRLSSALTNHWIYIFSYIKLVVTFVKYMPQAWLNYKRKSTVGWSIGQIQLDFAGGILSLGQLFIDASSQGDWSGVTGNPAKLGLSNISMFFDIIFIVQHYVLYRHRDEQGTHDEHAQEPLLDSI